MSNGNLSMWHKLWLTPLYTDDFSLQGNNQHDVNLILKMRYYVFHDEWYHWCWIQNLKYLENIYLNM